MIDSGSSLVSTCRECCWWLLWIVENDVCRFIGNGSTYIVAFCGGTSAYSFLCWRGSRTRSETLETIDRPWSQWRWSSSRGEWRNGKKETKRRGRGRERERERERDAGSSGRVARKADERIFHRLPPFFFPTVVSLKKGLLFLSRWNQLGFPGAELGQEGEESCGICGEREKEWDHKIHLLLQQERKRWM